MKMELGEYGMNTYLLRLVACLFLSVSLNSFGALSIRDLDSDWSNGFEGVYDDVLDITWSADAKPLVNNANVGGHSWSATASMTDNFSIGIYDDWRLPKRNRSSESYQVWDYTDGSNGEMYHMLYNNLGNLSHDDTNCWGSCLINNSFIDSETGEEHEFLNIVNFVYWLYEKPAWNAAGNFGISNGGSGWSDPDNYYYAWPVHDGDIGASPVPLPAGIYLFLSGLVGLGLMRGRNA